MHPFISNTIEKTRQIGGSVSYSFSRLGESVIFLSKILFLSKTSFTRFRLTVREIYLSGCLSLPVIIVSGLFVGMVLSFQGFETLSRFGATQSLGAAVALSLFRELGPVVSALLFASRAGSAVTAEIGLMKTTEQLDAMDMMAINPISRIIAPRFWAGVISMPLLAILFSFFGLLGGHLIGVELLGVDTGGFWSQIQSSVQLNRDVLSGLIKSGVFGFIVSWISVYQGYTSKPTPEGISIATTKTVVLSSLTVLASDFLLTASMF